MTGVIPSLGSMPSLGKLATHGRPDNWTTLGRIQSNMVIDFTSATISDTLAARGFTFTRSGATATRVNSSGVLETVAANTLRIDHDPTTLACLGGLFEEASTNAIRNSTMVGAAAGSPGTLPTNWSTSDAGLTRTVTVVTSEDGVPCVDIRWSGTASSTLVQVLLDANTAIAASASQAWTCSAYMRLVGGSLANVNSISPGITYRDSGGSALASGATSYALSGSALRTQRATHTATSPGSTAYAQGIINISVVNGAAVDFTLRIGAPQLEQKAFATSYIPTSTAAVTRNADALRCGTLGSWFVNTSGTLLAHVRRNVSVAGMIVEFGNSGSNIDRYGVNVAATLAIQAAGSIAGVSNNATTVNLTTVGTSFKAAGSFDGTGKSSCLNGGTVATSATGIVTSGYTLMDIGRATWGGVYLNGTISRIEYYPRRLTNAELQTITT